MVAMLLYPKFDLKRRSHFDSGLSSSLDQNLGPKTQIAPFRPSLPYHVMHYNIQPVAFRGGPGNAVIPPARGTYYTCVIL
ncbi:hypothetical protein FKM82_022821 [Ascaphus truei]